MISAKKLFVGLFMVSFFTFGFSPVNTHAIPVLDIPNTATNIWRNISSEVLIPIVQSAASRVVTKMSSSIISWANGGFDADPSFINNWGEFLNGTQHEVISSTFSYASNAANDNGIPLGGGNDPSGDAQSNYELWGSGSLDTSRFVAQTIAGFGVNQLADNDLERIINGEGETLTTILGSKQAKDLFFNDLTANQDSAVDVFHAYISAPDPHNTNRGLGRLVGQVLKQDIIKNEDQTLQEILAPTTLLSKKTCTDYKEDGSCAREIVETPGDIVAGQLSQSLGIDQDQALQLSNSLVGSLIKGLGSLVDGLTTTGLSQLTNVAANAFFSNNDIAVFVEGAVGQGAYSSEYDVLGIQNAGGTGGIFDGGSVGGNTGSTGTNQQGVRIFVGGPEHDDGTWDGGPIFRVDLEQDLQRNLNLSLEEQGYYANATDLLSDSIDVLFEFDKCIPGPDYGWEDRYRDVLPTAGNADNERDQLNALGLASMKQMIQDPRVNIPGANTMRSQIQVVLDTAKGKNSRNEVNLTRIRDVIFTLGPIKDSVMQDFAIQKLAIHPDLVLFEEDWYQLSQLQKQQLLGEAINRIYYTNSEYINGENILLLAALENDEEAIIRSVLAMAWELWRQETSEEDKLKVREIFNAMESKFSSQSTIATARAELSQLEGSISQSHGSAQDCLVFKSYAVGYGISEIQNIVRNSSLSDAEKIFGLANLIDQNDPNYTLASGGFLPGLVTAFYNVSNVRTDPVLDLFLDTQRNIQQSAGQSLFETSLMTGEISIAQSILGFAGASEKEDFFEENYPDDNLTFPTTKNRTTIKDIYEVDRMFGKGSRINPAGARGHLFCRTEGKYDLNGSSGGGDDGSECWKNFYNIGQLDYATIITGIN
jgi:hypothetical protein